MLHTLPVEASSLVRPRQRMELDLKVKTIMQEQLPLLQWKARLNELAALGPWKESGLKAPPLRFSELLWCSFHV